MADHDEAQPSTPGTDNANELLKPKSKDRHGDGQWGDVKHGEGDTSPRHHGDTDGRDQA